MSNVTSAGSHHVQSVTATLHDVTARTHALPRAKSYSIFVAGYYGFKSTRVHGADVDCKAGDLSHSVVQPDADDALISWKSAFLPVGGCVLVKTRPPQ